MLTDRRTDGTQNLYTSASSCRVQLCKGSKLYNKNFLSYRITTSIIASRRKCWRTDERTDGRTEPRIYTLLPLTVEYNCVKFQNCTIKTFWVIASQLKCWRTDRRTDGRTDGQCNYYRAPAFRIYTLLSLIVEYNCAKFQNCTIKTVWVIASQLWLSHHDENDWRTDERTGGRNPEYIHFCLLL